MTAPLFVLEAPQYHQLVPGTSQTFKGIALALDQDLLDGLEVRTGGGVVARARTGLASPDLAILKVTGSDACRFECEFVPERGTSYEFVARLRSGRDELLFDYAPPAAEETRMRAVAETVLALPFPPGEVVATTQGGTNVSSYAHSAVSGWFTLRRLLAGSGFDPDAVRTVLDVGCGTGRSLLAWHADDPARRLAGADINPELIAWARRELAGVADWRVSRLEPPLDFPSASFDLVQLASVFTHLPLPLQRRWLAELRRIARPGGAVVITLHGDVYARILLDEPARQALAEAGGYAEFPAADPGANAFSTFHSRDFAERLFREQFETVRFFPRGNLPVRPSLFPFAALQDAYVLS